MQVRREQKENGKKRYFLSLNWGADGYGWGWDNHLQHSRLAFVVEGQPARSHVEQHNAERPHVHALATVPAPADDLRRNVKGGAARSVQHVALRPRLAGIDNGCHTEVRKLDDLLRVINQDVFGLFESGRKITGKKYPRKSRPMPEKEHICATLIHLTISNANTTKY